MTKKEINLEHKDEAIWAKESNLRENLDTEIQCKQSESHLIRVC